ncbi:MAG: YdcF family protein [Saprospiraceae bacterium]|nr:YdcF family protein [Saprospiraceae bacterium]
MRTLRKLLIWGTMATILLILGIWCCNYWIIASTSDQVYDQVDQLPKHDVALVLGTSRLGPQGYRNPYFYSRIETAAKLFRAGKVKHFIVSGDNSIKNYNEPRDMRQALMDAGIPEKAITLDYAGFRTLDSVVRCYKIFDQKRFVVISQPFHTPRALFIANYYGLDVVAFNTPAVWKSFRTKTKIREYLARCKAVIDLYILQKEPRFLGEKEDIEIS